MTKKIAFWQTIGDSFKFVFTDWGRFFRLSGAWIAVTFVVFLAALALLGPAALQKTGMAAHPHLTLGWGVAALVWGAVIIVSNVAFAVAWHRAVLLGETAEPLRALRFRWREFRFLLYSAVMALIYIAVSVLNIAVGLVIGIALTAASGGFANGKLSGPAIAIVVLSVIVGSFVLGPLLMRLTLGLPAIAVEETHGILRRSWHRGWRNGWRLIWGAVICGLPLIIVSGVFSGLQTLSVILIGFGGVLSALGVVLDLGFYVLVLVANFLAIATGVSFLSLSYRQLASDAALAQPAAE